MAKLDSTTIYGDLTVSSDAFFGGNITGSGALTLGNAAGNQGPLYLYGTTAAKVASVKCTNGNIHLDSADGAHTLYLNYYNGTGGTIFGNGNTGGSGANISSTGVVTGTSFTGAGTGLTGTGASFTAGNATLASTITTTSRTTSASHYFVFTTTGGTSTKTLYSDSAATCYINPSTNVIGATTFIGALTGRSSLSLVNNSTSATYYPLVWHNNNDGLYDTAAAMNVQGSTGNIRTTGNVTAYYSDKRLKDIIGPIPNALDKIDKISGIYYIPNDLAEKLAYDPSKERKVGVIAQDVQKVLPEVVDWAPFDRDEKDNSISGKNYLTIHYDKIVPLLIEGIKENRKENIELRKTIDNQQIEIDDIKKQLKLILGT